MVDAAYLRHQIRKLREGPLVHVVIKLLVRFKGGTRIRHHLHDIVYNTSYKLKIMWWF